MPAVAVIRLLGALVTVFTFSMEFEVTVHLNNKMITLFKGSILYVLFLITLPRLGLCQHTKIEVLKSIATPPIPKKKDTIIYKFILSNGDTLNFDIKRRLACKEIMHPYKATFTTNKTSAKLLFLTSDTLIATIICIVHKTITDTSQVFNVWDISKPWYLSITKSYYCDIEGYNVKSSIDSINNEILRRFLKKNLTQAVHND